MNKLLLPIVLLLLMTTACKPSVGTPAEPIQEKVDVPVATDTPLTEETITEPTDTEDDEAVTLELMDSFEDLITPDKTAADLGRFITENISTASPAEADEMLEWLLIYQTDIMLAFNDLIYTQGYMDALNVSMGGVLDADKVSDIEDEAIRSAYQSLVDAYMTIVRYEETPVVETDWTRLAQYADLCSDDFAFLIVTRGEFHGTYTEDYYGMAEDVVLIEETLNTVESDFIKWQLSDLHKVMVSDLLIGPEGSFIDTFVTKEADYYTSDLYSQLVAFSTAYPDTSFGAHIQALDSSTWEDYNGPLALTNTYLTFGYKSPFTWSPERVVTDAGTYEVLHLTSENHPILTATVNNHLMAAINQIVEESKGATAYDLYFYNSFSNDHYVSVNLSLYYSDADFNAVYIDHVLTYDLSTGEQITLNDYLGMSDEEVLKTINGLAASDFQYVPEFELSGYGIALRSTMEDPTEVRYVAISLKDLVPYVNHNKLYR